MAIKGSLKEASLPDVLQLLALGQKTGCLSIADQHNFGYIYFDQGRIVYASIVNRRDRIGDLLVRHGRLTQDQLNAAVDAQSRSRDTRLGQILIRQGFISRDDLEEYMRIQIEEAVYFLFTWTQGTFNFETGVKPEHEEFRVAINPESLLLEGARRVDEWSLIEKKIPSFDLIFTVDHERLSALDVELTHHQRQILSLLDGEHDVAQVIEETGLVEFDVGKALYGLLSAGFAHRAGRSRPSAPVRDVAESRIQEHRNLGIAFFRTAMLDEAAREFRRVSELRPNDGGAHFFLGVVALRQARWRDAAESLERAVEHGGGTGPVLHNLGLAYERGGQFDKADDAYGEASSRARHDPRIMTSWGISALQRAEYQVAEGRLDRARELGGESGMPAIWYWARALAAAAQEQYDRAEELLRTGLERHPRHPVLANNLAVLLEFLGDLDRAEELLREALTEEPTIPQLSKNLGDILYRRARYDEAFEVFQRTVKLDPQLGDDVYFKLGNVAYRRTDRDQAAAFWRQALEINPNHQLAKTNLDTLNALT